MTYAKRDANERAILATLRALGVWYYQMDRNAGFDLLLAHCGRLFVVEIKDGARPVSGKRLTPNEDDTRTALEWHGIPYAICETLDEVLRVIGST